MTPTLPVEITFVKPFKRSFTIFLGVVDPDEPAPVFKRDKCRCPGPVKWI